MSTSAKNYIAVQLGICFMFMVFSLVFPDGGLAENAVEPISPLSRVYSLSGQIHCKSTTTIAVKERLFEVTDQTTILNKRGEEIALNQLPIPCEAVLEYQLRGNKSPLCIKIIVAGRPNSARFKK